MNTTNLNLLVIKHWDKKHLYLQDVSQYNPDIVPTNTLLEITPPDHTFPTNITYVPNTTIVLNSNTFKWSNTNSVCDLGDLPDGVWKITQSVCPNDKVNRCYFHFRAFNLLEKILEYCEDVCEIRNHKDILFILQDLELAEFLAESGKWKEANIIYKASSQKFKSISNGV